MLWGEQYGAASGEILRPVKGRRTAPLCQQHAQPTLCPRRPSEIVEMVVPPGNHPAVPRGSNLKRTLPVSGKVRLSRRSRARRGELVAGSLSKDLPRTPGPTAVSAVAVG